MPAPGLAWPCLAVPYRRSSRLVDAILVALKAKTGAPRDLRRDAPRVRGRCKRPEEVLPAAPRCRYLVIVDDPDYCRAGAAFDARNFPHVSCRGETVHHREVERRPIGSAFGTAIAERRWGLAGYLHLARRHEPPLAPGDGPSSARLRTQGDFEVLANSH